MANYKASVLNDNPVSFHTFDLDSQVLHESSIIDEIGNVNPMTMFGSNYELEYTSLNPLETTDQNSILFARNGKYLDDWVPVWGVIPHTVDYNLSEWTIEFILDIDYAGAIRNSGEPGYYKDIQTPIINKGSAIHIYVLDSYYYSSTKDGIYCKILGDSRSVQLIDSARHPVFNQPIHVVCTYKVDQIDVNQYETVLKMYVNGRNVGTSTATHYDSPPNMLTGSEWLVCGDHGMDNELTDYPTQFTALDQLAIYNYPFTDEQVSNHYRKTKTYKDMMVLDYPSHYWRLNDTTELNTTMVATKGYSGNYYGSYLKNEPAMDNVLDAHSVKFWNNGTSIISKKDDYWKDYNQMINTNANYTVEFWFRTEQPTKGALFSCLEDLYKYRGVVVYINSYFGQEQHGVIEIQEGLYNIQTPLDYNYSDDKWHHFVLRRSGSTLIVNIDGEEVGRASEVPVTGTTGDPAQVHLMDVQGGQLPVEGWMSEVAMYTEALQTMQINSRYHFSTRHKVFGYTLLEGQGISSEVRFYDNITGELVGDINSQSDGEYTFYTYSNKRLDIVALLPENVTTRYRIHAPITPGLYEDPHDTGATGG